MPRLTRVYYSKHGRLIFTPILLPFLALVIALENHFQGHQSWWSAVSDAVVAMVIVGVILFVGFTWVWPAIQRRRTEDRSSGPQA
jgi:uncharacterized BrkB/YihY/UPF0761 family membrane protein